jgi:FdhD protein
VLAVRGDTASYRGDAVVTEEPMEIRVRGLHQEPVAVAVTMRTPGADFELAVGFLHTEGLLADPTVVSSVTYCDEEDLGQPAPGEASQSAGDARELVTGARDGRIRPVGSAKGSATNTVTVALGVPFAPPTPRAFVAGAACGICGSTSIEALARWVRPVGEGVEVSLAVLRTLPLVLRERQRVFAATGGLHAAGLFAPSGELSSLAEDVGRHNALDKLIGRAALAGALPIPHLVLLVSGRVSFEIIQKAAVAGISVVAAVSAPSSLAIATAEALNMTLVGFLRDTSCNVYTHPRRVVGSLEGGGASARGGACAGNAPISRTGGRSASPPGVRLTS